MTQDLPDIGLADLLERTEEAGECLEWTGFAMDGKFPQWRVGGALWVVRRLLWLLTRGPLKPRVQVGLKCKNELCVHPDHLVARSKSTAMQGHPVTFETRLRITYAARARGKLTMDEVREIRARTGLAKDIDEEFGLYPGYASRIRRNDRWKDHANPFSGLEPH